MVRSDKGGCWSSWSATSFRLGYRGGIAETEWYPVIGFRLIIGEKDEGVMTYKDC